MNILIVDDSLIIRKNLNRFFTNLGHTVLGEAENGNDAIAKCKELENIDLITMDITMPEMDGIETTKKIKEFLAEVTVVMITSHGQEELVSSALKAGAKNFILKPITEEKLSDTLQLLFPDA